MACPKPLGTVFLVRETGTGRRGGGGGGGGYMPSVCLNFGGGGGAHQVYFTSQMCRGQFASTPETSSARNRHREQGDFIDPRIHVFLTHGLARVRGR